MARIDDGPRAAEPDDAEAEATVVVDREAEAETLLVERTTARRAAVKADGSAETEGTLAVTRQRGSNQPAGGAASVPSTGRRRRGMTMPPVPAGYGRGAIDAVGPGAVESYQPRDMPDLVAAPLEFAGVEATRVASTELPSVERRARRTSLVALTIFTASCVVSVAGLIALGLAVF
jgi:hypothetical protein